MRANLRISAFTFTTFLLLPAPSVALAASAGNPGDAAASAKTLLDAGKGGEALAKARDGLEYEPDSFELLDLASRAAKSTGSTDEALWYGGLALLRAEQDQEKKSDKAIAEVRARLLELDPLGQKCDAVQREYASALLTLGADCSKRKLPVTSVGLLTRLRGTSARDKADAELAKIYGNKKAVESLLDSGADVPAKPARKRTLRQIAFEDSKHATWNNAYEIKGDQYTIRTDMGIELAEAFSSAMEQINQFYRKVFRVKERGGDTARMVISVYRSRAEFDEHEKENDEPIPADVAGFFAPGENRVATYDPRQEGRTLGDLWSTLFHESSHQFTHIALTGGNEPTWLNEGTASYFEGARYLPNGTVEFNLIPTDRLGALQELLGQGHPTLTEVVQYNEDGSYPGEYYPFGWGLVYFMHNYENEKSERVYVQPYRDFMATYKEGRKHDVKARFVEYFVTKAKQPGVKTFEDFEKRWKAWIGELFRLYFGPPEVADELIQRARKQHADKQDDSAIETYAWALRQRADDPVAYREMAEILAAQKKVDAALHNFRMAIRCVRALPDPSAKLPSSGELTAQAIGEACAQRIQKLDETFGTALAQADAKYVKSSIESAKAYADAKFPLVALELLDSAPRMYGRSAEIDAARTAIAQASGADNRRWRRLPMSDKLDEWEAEKGWSAQAGVLSCASESPSYCLYRDDLPDAYRFEARLDASSLDPATGYIGLVFCVDYDSVHSVGMSGGGHCKVIEHENEWKIKQELPDLQPELLKSVVFAVEMRRSEIEFFVDGKSVAKLPYTPEQIAGRIGFMMHGGSARFTDVRVKW